MTVTLAAEASEWALVGGAGWKSAASEHVNCAQQDDSHRGHFSSLRVVLFAVPEHAKRLRRSAGAHHGRWVRSQ
jgi:hypothetical protein